MSEQLNSSEGRSDASVLHRACCEKRPVSITIGTSNASANDANDECVGALSVNSAINSSTDVFRIKNLSEHHRRKYLKTRDVALAPSTSLERFKESFTQSKAPDRLKQRFTNFSPSTSSGRPPDEGGDATS